MFPYSSGTAWKGLRNEGSCWTYFSVTTYSRD